MDGAKNGLKGGGGGTHNQARPSSPSPWRSKPIKNRKLENSSRHKRSRMSGKHRWAFRLCQTYEQQTSFLAYTGNGAHARPRHYLLVHSQYKSGGSWVRGKRGYGLARGSRESPFWGFRLYSFGGDVLLGWHTTQKKEGWVGTIRCMP